MICCLNKNTKLRNIRRIAVLQLFFFLPQNIHCGKEVFWEQKQTVKANIQKEYKIQRVYLGKYSAESMVERLIKDHLKAVYLEINNKQGKGELDNINKGDVFE